MRKTIALAFLLLVSSVFAQRLSRVTYQGRVRSPAWVAEHYEEFKGKIAIVDGQYYPAFAAHFGEKFVSTSPRPPGLYHQCFWDETLRPPQVAGASPVGAIGVLIGRVLQVTGDDSALISAGRATFHLEYFAGMTGLVDGAKLPPLAVVIIGRHSYTTVMGAQRTVRKVRPIGELDKKEFAAALNQGIILQRFIERKTRCRRCRGRGQIAKWYRGRGTTRIRQMHTRKETCSDCSGRGEIVKSEWQTVP